MGKQNVHAKKVYCKELGMQFRKLEGLKTLASNTTIELIRMVIKFKILLF